MLQKNKYWFTLVELTIAMVILSIIIAGISISLVKVWENFNDNTVKTSIFSDIKDFNYDSYLFKYNSGMILTGGLLLYTDKRGILIGAFKDGYKWYDYQLDFKKDIFSKTYFWYFNIKTNVLTGILNEWVDISTLKFNDGKIFKNLVIKDFEVKTYNGGTIFELNFQVFKRYLDEYTAKLKKDIVITPDEYLKFNFNF